MLRSAQRLRRFNVSLSLHSLQAPLSSGLDYATRTNNDSNHRLNLNCGGCSFPAMHYLVSHRCFSTTQCDPDTGSSETPPQLSTMSDGVINTESDGVTTTTIDTMSNGEFTLHSTTPSFEETMDKIFDATQQQLMDVASVEAATAAAKEAGLLWEPSLWRPTDLAVETIRFVHDTCGFDYGWSIIAVTVGLRLALLPLAAVVQANQSRMAHMMPEMNVLNDKYKAIRNPTREEQLRHAQQVSALFKKFQANPLRSLWLPVVQLPAFIGLFFGLQKMTKFPIFHDDLSTGGMLWFTDLTIPDPLYVLPLTSALSFLAIIELTRTIPQGGMSDSFQKSMTNGMRAIAIIMIPVSVSFPSAVVAYWTTNNICTFAQMAAFKLEPVKKALNIWDPPKPVPGAKDENLYQTLKNSLVPKPTQEQLIKKHNDKVESEQKMRELSKHARSLRQGGGIGKRVVGKIRK